MALDNLPKNLSIAAPPAGVAAEWSPAFLDQALWSKMREVMSSWLGTPYKHCTMVKGRGADCTLFIGACWKELGILTAVTWDYYSKDWHIHTTEEKVLDGLYQHFSDYAGDGYCITKMSLDDPLLQGDVITFALTPTKVSNHAAIFLGETERGKVMLHSVQSKGVSIFPLAGYFEKHKSCIFRVMRHS